MKRAFYLVVVLGLLVQQGIWFAPAAVQASSPAAPLLQSGDEPVAAEPVLDVDPSLLKGAMPGYPDPPKPIPYNKPGYPSKMGIDTRLQLANAYQPWAASVSAMSTEEAMQALDYDQDYDPFASNYTLVEWDNLAVIDDDAGAQRFRTYFTPNGQGKTVSSNGTAAAPRGSAISMRMASTRS